MGIYYDNKIFGVKVTDPIEPNKVLFEEKYDAEMTDSEKKEFANLYLTMWGNLNPRPYIQIYTQIWTTYDDINDPVSWLWHTESIHVFTGEPEPV